MKTLEFLPVSEFKVLKIIEIHGKSWNRFFGFLPYLRSFNKDLYDKETLTSTNDELDERILAIIQADYPEATISTKNIFFKGELEERLQLMAGGTTLPVTIQLFPLIPFIEANQFQGRTFSAYPLQLSLRLHLPPNSEKLNHIRDYYLCNLPYDRIDRLAETIFSA